MAAQIEAKALVSGRCAADQEQLGAALVAALELALLAAHRLLGGLDGAAGRHVDAAAHLARAQALAGACAAPRERARALLTLDEPLASSGEEAAARAELGAGRGRPVPVKAESAAARAKVAGSGGTASVRTASAYPAELTHREVEVLRLIAAGQSNRAIAAALYLSPRTVERHVANIYLKIGAHSKAEATAYACRHRLA
jgi:DNA-binding NarL/FixJ family response regulator